MLRVYCVLGIVLSINSLSPPSGVGSISTVTGARLGANCGNRSDFDIMTATTLGFTQIQKFFALLASLTMCQVYYLLRSSELSRYLRAMRNNAANEC